MAAPEYNTFFNTLGYYSFCVNLSYLHKFRHLCELRKHPIVDKCEHTSTLSWWQWIPNRKEAEKPSRLKVGLPLVSHYMCDAFSILSKREWPFTKQVLKDSQQMKMPHTKVMCFFKKHIREKHLTAVTDKVVED